MAAREWIIHNPDGTRSVIPYQTTPEADNYDSILASARSALAANRTYVALASPTTAQTTAQVKALSRQVNGLIRVLLASFDGTD